MLPAQLGLLVTATFPLICSPVTLIRNSPPVCNYPILHRGFQNIAMLKLRWQHPQYHDNTATPRICLFVKVKLVIVTRTLDLAGVCILQVALNDVVSVLADRPQTSLLHDGGNNGA